MSPQDRDRVVGRRLFTDGSEHDVYEDAEGGSALGGATSLRFERGVEAAGDGRQVVAAAVFRFGRGTPGVSHDLATLARVEAEGALADAAAERAVGLVARVGAAVAGPARVDDLHLPLLGARNQR